MKKLVKRKNILKEAGVLLVAAILVLTSLFVFTPMTRVTKAQPAVVPPFYEDFEGTWGPYGNNPPSGWTILDYGSESPPVWNNNDWHKYSYSTFGSNCARLYYSPYESMNEELITPEIDCLSCDTVILKFRQYFYYYAAYPGYGYVEGSYDGGLTFPYMIAQYSSTQTSDYYTYPISSWAAGQQHVKIRFRYDTPGSQGRYWYIDDVEITCGDVNQAPIANPDIYSVCYGSTNTFDVLVNDGDPDGDSITINSVTPPTSGGSAAPDPTNTMIIYTPGPGFTGTDTFDYTITDGTLASTPVTVTVDVCCIEIVDIRMHPSAAQDKIEVEIKNHCGMNLNGGNRVQLTWEFTIDPNPPCCGGAAYLTDPTNNPLPFVYDETNLLDNCNNGASATGSCRVKGNAFFTLKLTAFVPPTGCSCEKIVTGCVGQLQLC
jgi:hypothetical protein